MLMLEANFQIQKFQIDVTPVSATTKRKTENRPRYSDTPGLSFLVYISQE